MQHASDGQMCAICDVEQRLKASDTVVGRWIMSLTPFSGVFFQHVKDGLYASTTLVTVNRLSWRRA